MRKLLGAITLGAAIVPAVAGAQDYRGMQRDQTRAEAQQRADMMFQMMDADHDGTVTKAEAAQAMTQFQASRDGDSGRGGGRMQRMMDQAFATSPSLTLQQFESQALARFDAADLNHDGILTAAERQQARSQSGTAPNVMPAPQATPAKPQ